MNLKAALNFPLRAPSPYKNICLVALCNLIPIVGPMVLMGYGVPIEKALVHDLDAAPPAFDFGRFSEYLQRGIIPFVVMLVASLCLIPFVFIAEGVFLVLVILGKDHPAAIAAAVILLVVMLLALGMVAGVLLVAFFIRASLEG